MENNNNPQNIAVLEAPTEVETQAPVTPEAAKDFGITPVKRLVQVDGVLVPQDEYNRMRDAGQDVTVHASAGRQS